MLESHADPSRLQDDDDVSEVFPATRLLRNTGSPRFPPSLAPLLPSALVPSERGLPALCAQGRFGPHSTARQENPSGTANCNQANPLDPSVSIGPILRYPALLVCYSSQRPHAYSANSRSASGSMGLFPATFR
ncbi:uncharacterized protein VTP21DRAFT_2060 [Calcarisporiella thermophila]|uniref:uncharacterized protein n=1 Tax=Calcarisporiella thermophila TaxID=911321 RepID=UPI00374280D9